MLRDELDLVHMSRARQRAGLVAASPGPAHKREGVPVNAAETEHEDDDRKPDRPPPQGRKITQAVLTVATKAGSLWLIFDGSDDETSTWVKVSIVAIRLISAVATRR